jgi:hypothetical protein
MAERDDATALAQQGSTSAALASRGKPASRPVPSNARQVVVSALGRARIDGERLQRECRTLPCPQAW